MTQHKATDLWYTCDLCNKECKPVRELRITHSYWRDLVNEVHLSIRAHVPYVTGNGDVCNDCLNEALMRHLGIRRGGE